jgi:hypothetical protein
MTYANGALDPAGPRWHPEVETEIRARVFPRGAREVRRRATGRGSGRGGTYTPAVGPYLLSMADDRAVKFGSFLDRETSDKKIWLLVIPILAAVIAGSVWAFSAVSRADSFRAEADRERAQNAELQKSLEERDKLLVQARAEEGVLKSAGQASSLFYGVAPDATESGLVIANPSEKAAKVYLYGLVAPPAGQEYVIAARGADGTPRPLGTVLPSEAGTAFLLAKDLPDGANVIEVLFRATGSQSLDGAAPRVAARFPANENERGILTEPVQGQARRGGGRARR